MSFFDCIEKVLNLPKNPYTRPTDLKRQFVYDLNPEIAPVNPKVDGRFNQDDSSVDEDLEKETGWKVYATVAFSWADNSKIKFKVRAQKSIIDLEFDQRVYERNVRYVGTKTEFVFDESWNVSNEISVFALLVSFEDLLCNPPPELFVQGQNLNTFLMQRIGRIKKYDEPTDTRRFAHHIIATLDIDQPVDVMERVVRRKMASLFDDVSD